MKLEEYKNAADLALEVDPETIMFVYCYKDKAVDKFVPPFINDKEPKFMVDGVKSAVIKGDGRKQLTGLQLCFCGTFELKTGKFVLYEKPELILDCDILIDKLGGDYNVNNKA